MREERVRKSPSLPSFPSLPFHTSHPGPVQSARRGCRLDPHLPRLLGSHHYTPPSDSDTEGTAAPTCTADTHTHTTRLTHLTSTLHLPSLPCPGCPACPVLPRSSGQTERQGTFFSYLAPSFKSGLVLP